MREIRPPDEDGQQECRCDECGTYWMAGPEDNHDVCPECEAK